MRIESMTGGNGFQQKQNTQNAQVSQIISQTSNSKGMESEKVTKSTSEELAKHVEKQAQKAQAETKKEQEQTEQQVIQAIEQANKHFKTYDRRLEFSIHDTTKQIMVKVINTEDDSIIREIPSEKILDMVSHMWEVAGILVDEKR